MTFGKIKSIIENNLLESYKDEKEFKKSLKEFKQNVLNNKKQTSINPHLKHLWPSFSGNQKVLCRRVVSNTVEYVWSVGYDIILLE